MNKINLEKLSVTYLPPATEFNPVDGRKYTLTHSDTTGELYLSIGNGYAFSSINPNTKDEVLAEWVTHMGQYMLNGKVYISGGEYGEEHAKARFIIFKNELELAITAIVYGDRSLYLNYPWLLDSPIYIKFESIFPQFNQVLYFGTPRQYLSNAMKQTFKKTQV
ncbi:staygreen family protein [Bacillus massilinigeriensis]|uniref:staygreen family protein n=1 Tax=Bacillus massilionigeriensis TaxID=1805475 RepID=UPI00096B093A|nr:staygreen family protein [Bacillus massilionigeriensis]